MYDKGCISGGSTYGMHRVESRLWNLRRGDDWQWMCGTTPATINGIEFTNPTRCENRGIFYGMVGMFEYPDPACGWNAMSELSADDSDAVVSDQFSEADEEADEELPRVPISDRKGKPEDPLPKEGKPEAGYVDVLSFERFMNLLIHTDCLGLDGLLFGCTCPIFSQDKEDKNAYYEDRVVRAIVYTRYSSVRPLFAESRELILLMVHQMIDYLDDLWTKERILHRDISLNNIMYEKRGDHYHFVLINFDMAVVVPANEGSYTASSRHRTGTLSFMAQELICDAWTALQRGSCWTPIKHLFRHDLESLFWNSLWGSVMLPNKGLSSKGIDKLVKGVRKWETGIYNIAGTKEQIILKGLESNNIVLPPAAARLNKWFKAWVKVLSSTYMIVAAKARRGSDSDSSDDEEPVLFADWETGGGVMTKEHLQKALLKVFPIPNEYLPASEEPVRVVKTKIRIVKADVAKNAPRPQHLTRKKPKVVTPTVMPENDIRSRLRPRRPRL
ncbi:hypothetical protein NM688_g9388 [Phlebia brevispora]|uniref:Uncharacterized protein n=1 Tax=Phlebia brevispora TaxID=194682 RepID=A0ACC1RGW5_9APHY|nr:hypothetical protein NM688_g9388 [Phlebia brevispora]